MKLAKGFLWAGIQAGIKPNRKDLALVYSETPCSAAGCFTQNLAKAAPVLDAEKRLPAEQLRAVVINSGNANALTGPEGLEDVKTVCEAAAKQLRIPLSAVLTASTGVIGVRLPAHKIVAAMPALSASLKPDAMAAAEAIMTTDTRVKLASRTVAIGGKDVTLTCICKGSGMIAPSLATMIAVVATDCAIKPHALAEALQQAMRRSFNALTVDGDMSTNDCVFALANGAAGNAPIADPGPSLDAFSAALDDVCRQMAKEIALDLAKACAGSSLVKAAIFGADPNWGRVLASIGARAGTAGYAIEPAEARVTVQDVAVYDRAPLAYDASVLKARMREPEVRVLVDLRRGEEKAQAWGCDLSYDYVKINADYTSLIVTTPDGGVAKDDRLSNYSPTFKVKLLVDALGYIQKFSGTRCVIKYGGAAIEMVLTGSVNTELVTLLNGNGSALAVGVSGKDGGLIRARKLMQEGRDLGQVGEVTQVNRDFLEMLLQQGYVPVISPVGLGADGQSYNINADNVAAEVAVAIGAQKLIYLSDVPGILKAGELIGQLTAADLETLIDDGTIVGGMKAKAKSILKVLSAGVHSVHLLDGRVPHSIIGELFTDNGVGSWIRA
ncbi:MAG: acetylglutamate kinase [Deltaproteobacteria bacterium]|nr:MAG: acetylglutamate kinase [Deltaproteobacteria bacterium]